MKTLLLAAAILVASFVSSCVRGAWFSGGDGPPGADAPHQPTDALHKDFSAQFSDGASDVHGQLDSAPGDFREADLNSALDTRPPDTRRPDTRRPDTRPPDTRPPDTRPPDTRPPDTGSSTVLVTSANDTCATAVDVNLASGPVTISASTQGATNNYSALSCCKQVDVVIRLRNAASRVRIACTGGGGSIDVLNSLEANTCPSSAQISCVQGLPCTGYAMPFDIPSPTQPLVICRSDTAPATITLQNQ